MKDDFLRECLSEVSAKAKQSIPLDDFQKEFCLYCYNKQCSRSGASNTLFDRRAEHWYKDKFLDVPRAKEDDSRFSAVKASWANAVAAPLKVGSFEPLPERPPAKFEPISVPEAPVQTLDAIKEPEPAPVAPDPAPAVEVASVPVPAPVPAKPVVKSSANTPFDSALYIGPKEDRETVMEPGGTFTFGDED